MTDPNKALQLTWTEPEFPFAIEISVTALERLRRAALAGLQSLPRIGLGVGGFLLGTKEDARLTVTDFIEIPSSHATGPSFNLTAEERELALKMSRAKREKEVVGWYLTKTRGPLEVDKDMYGDFCPEPWQITLLIRPASVRKTMVLVVSRNPQGEVVYGTEREIAEWTLPFDTMVDAVDSSLSLEPVREVKAPPAPPVGAEGFESVRTFGLMKPDPSRPPRKPALAQATDQVPVPEGTPDTPFGFQSILGVKLGNAPVKPLNVDLPPSTPGEAQPFEAIRTVRFMGGKSTVASPLHPEFDEPQAEPEAKPQPPPPLSMPDGPIGFEPVRHIKMSGKQPSPSLVKPAPESSEGQQSQPQDSARFEPSRKSMFAEEPNYGPVRPVEAVVNAPLPPPPKLSPFTEALPERRQPPEPVASAPPSYKPLSTVAFMSQAEKEERRRGHDFEPEPAPVVVAPPDPAKPPAES